MTTFSADARWIWTGAEASPRNFWLRFRRIFSAPNTIKRSTLLITADNRYELYFNGHAVGNGPVRSFPWTYGYDEYDITSWLHAGADNLLAARVVHWGDQTFQSIRARGGFLCDLVLENFDGQITHIVSDESWQFAPDTSMRSQTPRISIQQGYEEQYDARQDQDWTSTIHNAVPWQPAHIIGPIGTAPWTELVPRTIPFLMRDPVPPTQILALELAQLPAGYRWCFDMRHRIKNPTTGIHANPISARGMAFATEIIAPHTCTITLAHANAHDYQGGQMSCNGQPAQSSTLELHAGRNLFTVTGTDWPSLYFQTSASLTFDASHIVPDAPNALWAYLGPCDERGDAYTLIRSASQPAQLPAVPRQPIHASDNMEDIYLLTKAQRFLLPDEGFCDPSIRLPQPRESLPRPHTPIAANISHLLHHNADYALLYPQAEGDLHLILDFGRELCGYPVIELDAAAGTVVDANFFEGIDASGIFWTENLRNSLRYTCRSGHQTFRSHQRRGFRYASLTFRMTNANPIKLYNVHCLLNTYPVEQLGSFACSDTQLTTIWNVAAYTVQLCMEDTYVDCPAYEQVFWVGDARNSALVNAMAFGASALTERCIRLTGQSLSRNLDPIKPPQLQQRAHLTTDHVVSGWFSEIPMWTFLWIWNIWEHYQLTGDQAVLAELYPAVRECLERCLSFLTPRGLFNIPDVWNLIEWSANDLTRDGEVTASNALLAESLRKAALMADALSYLTPEDATSLHSQAAHYLTSAKHITQALNTYCWSEQHNAYVDTVRDETGYAYHVTLSQQYNLPTDTRTQFLARTRISEQTNTLVLLCRCAPLERAKHILPLVEAARNGQFVGSAPQAAPDQPPDQIVPVGSPWFLFFTLETLILHNQVENAIALIKEQWGRMLEKGATSFWETFPSLTGPHWSRSLCHGWSAAPAYFLSTQILGVQPATPGYQHVRITPQNCNLSWARGTVPTPHGNLSVDWTRDQTGWNFKLTLPTSISGELIIPKNGDTSPTYISGQQGEINHAQHNWHIIFPHGGTTHYHIE